jgi:hypothetical protein
MSTGRRPRGEDARPEVPPRRAKQGAELRVRAARLPSGPCTVACARHRGLEAITTATAGSAAARPPWGPPLGAGRWDGPAPPPVPRHPPPAPALPSGLRYAEPGASLIDGIRPLATN